MRPHGRADETLGEAGDAGTLDADQLALLGLMAGGAPMVVVAKQLSISERTLRRRVQVLCDQLGVETSIEAVVVAVRRGWI